MESKTMIEISGEVLKLVFSEWGSDEYDLFIQSKNLPEHDLSYDWKTDSYTITAPARFAHVFGIKNVNIKRDWLPFPENMHDYQKFFLERCALPSKRFACWFDTGLGKTYFYLEWARQVSWKTNGRVLLIVPLNILQQTIDEAHKFYADYQIKALATREEMKAWCKGGAESVGIVNPEKFIPVKGEPEAISEIKHCTGVVLDEASILASGGGKIKWALIKSCRGIEYKLTCTATPARNDTMDYASQGSFLEKLRNENEILWTFFSRDKEGNWRVKKHAEAAFYRFLSGWSCYLRSPLKYGFKDNLKDLPAPIIKEYRLKPTKEQMDLITHVPDARGQLMLFGNKAKLQMVDRSKYGQIAKGFIYEGDSRKPKRIHSSKPGFVVDKILKDAASGLKVLCWTVFDEESEIIMERLNGRGYLVECLHGSIPMSKRIPIIERFRKGESDILVSKASLLGKGLNFQNCGSVVFSGFDDSFEKLYQAIRRAYRYGQTKSVKIHIPYIPELEGVVWQNVQEKQTKFERDVSIMERNFIDAMNTTLNLSHGRKDHDE